MRLRPGSLAWLAAHDLTLNWRRFVDTFARLSPPAMWGVAMGCAAALHLLAWPVVLWLLRSKGGIRGLDAAALAVAMVCVLAWMTAQALLAATRLLYERGSLDLLLASPLPVRRALAAQALAIAAGSFGSVGILLLPLVHMGALLDGCAWLSAYPVLAALALAGTGAGLAAAIGLFSLFGPRRARLVAQLAAAFIGGAFLLALQVAAMLPAGLRQAAAQWLAGSWLGAALDPAVVLALPVAAARGDPVSLVLLVGLAAGLLAAVVLLLGERFRRASLGAAGAGADTGPAWRRRRRGLRVASGLGQTLRRKEWRLLRRDHAVFAQLSLQIVYTLPLAVVLVRGAESMPLVLALAPTIVVIAAQVAASLAWVTVSGEDAPELIAAAPVRRAEVETAKLSAIALPIAAILALPLAGLAMLAPASAALVALFATAAGGSTALLNLWHPMPGNRRGMLRRHSQSKLMGLVEHLMAMLWAVAVVLALVGTVWSLLPAGLAALLLLSCTPARTGPTAAAVSGPGTRACASP